MACGKPVVLTNTEGLWEKTNLAHMRNIVYVPPGEPEALARAVNRLIQARELREEIGEAARKYVEAHGDIHHFSRRLEKRCSAIGKRVQP